MYNLLERYRQAIRDLCENVDTRCENIVKAGEMIAESVANGGAIHLSNIAHHIQHDLIGRGGGLALYKHFNYELKVENGGVFERDRSGIKRNTEGLARYALEASNVMPGDVLVVSSVSGRTLPVVDLAWEAKKFGVKVIALISMEYAQVVDPVHSSGQKLYEFADVVLDNCAPAAEAMLDVEGIDVKFAAASGISSAYIMWSVTAVALEALMAKGLTPAVYMSGNMPGGWERLEKTNKDYRTRGY